MFELMWRQIMVNKSSLKLTLSVLLFAALCLEAVGRIWRIVCPGEKMNWTEARLYCQKNHIDMATSSLLDRLQPNRFLESRGIEQVWIGLLRDPEDDSVWKWINVKSGEGITGDDVSRSTDWGNQEQNGGHCAVVGDGFKWYSKMCSHTDNFLCSAENKIQYYDGSLNWKKASETCKQHSTGDLATITATDTVEKTGWIGLYREARETWKWVGNQSSDYRNWAEGEPNYQDCGAFDLKTLQWKSKICSTELQVFCYDDNLVLVNENKTWEDALWHCRNLKTTCEDPSEPCIRRYQLLTLTHHNYVRHRIYRATTDEVWTGLRFLGGEWWWADGQKVEDQGILPDCPAELKHCGTLSKYDNNKWITRDCSERRNFICYRKRSS